MSSDKDKDKDKKTQENMKNAAKAVQELAGDKPDMGDAIEAAGDLADVDIENPDVAALLMKIFCCCCKRVGEKAKNKVADAQKAKTESKTADAKNTKK